MLTCQICHEEIVSEPVVIPTNLETPEGHQVVFQTCLKCQIIISALGGNDQIEAVLERSQDVLDVMLDLLVTLEVMLAVDLNYTHEQEPRKSVREALDKWVTLATNANELSERRPGS